jgi:hypothetical protein
MMLVSAGIPKEQEVNTQANNKKTKLTAKGSSLHLY